MQTRCTDSLSYVFVYFVLYGAGYMSHFKIQELGSTIKQFLIAVEYLYYFKWCKMLYLHEYVHRI